ncbi:MAG: hypothetical protein LBE34_16380 [Flavobacteriaceae bacterium]|jgi:hypothetical protein|nr:hypothetical protein [Flavobacteriaceae bacterium]
MKAEVLYNDFFGTVSADVSDMIAVNKGSYISSIGEYFDVDEERFKVVGLSLEGIDNFRVALICLDKQKSTESQDHLVKMEMDLDVEGQKRMLNLLFKRLNFVLYNTDDENYANLTINETVQFDQFHQLEVEEEE